MSRTSISGTTASISPSGSESRAFSRQGAGSPRERPTKYFCTYSTDRFEVLSSPAYKKVLASQTDWSKKHISRFRNFGRVVGRVTESRGQGRGAVLGVVRLRPGAEDGKALRTRLHELLDPGMLPGIISMHLIESDPELSKNLNKPDEPNPGAGDWYVLIDGTDVAAVRELMAGPFQGAGRAGHLNRRLSPDVGPR